MTDEANIAEAELAKVIRAEEFFPPHNYTRPEDAEDDFEDCEICDETAIDCRRQQAVKENDAKTLARAILAAGYRKRSDVLEEAAKVADDAQFPEKSKCLPTPRRGFELAQQKVATSIRNLKDKP